MRWLNKVLLRNYPLLKVYNYLRKFQITNTIVGTHQRMRPPKKRLDTPIQPYKYKDFGAKFSLKYLPLN